MVKLKEIPRTAAFAWSPISQDPLLVTGTVAGAIDADFSSTTQLELWDLSLLNRSPEAFQLNSKKAIDTDARFYDIAWGAVSDHNPRGLIAGALESGGLHLWKPESVLNGDAAPFEKSTKHSGAIKSIKFNPIQSKVLASGGSKGEIYVWDLTKMDSPYSPGTQSSRHDEIEAVAWNRSVSHILATGGNTGFTSVWDLRNRREVLHLHYSSQTGARHTVSAVQWHPNNSTKLATASIEDNSPVVLLWDLRNANAPEKILQGHDKGVLSLDWCSQDSELLLSSGKDNRTILWNPETGDKIGEYPIATNWAFETRFNPTNPEILASASFDGQIVVQSLQDVSAEPKQKNDVRAGEDFWNSTSLVDALHPTFNVLKVPKWLNRPVSAEFGFGGKIAVVTTVDNKSSVKITSFVGNENLQEDTTRFASALESKDESKIVDYRKDSATSDKYDWDLLSVLADSQEQNVRSRLEEFLYNGKVDKKEETESKSNGVTGNEKANEEDLFGKTEDDEFLSKLSIKDVYKFEGPFTLFGKGQSETDKEISRNILKGDIGKAVDICLDKDQMMDAFMLSLNGDATSRKKVQDAYMKKYAENKPFVRLLASVGSGDLDDICENCDVKEWKDIFLGISSYAKDKSDFGKLLVKLGDRIIAAKDQKKVDVETRNAALLCYSAGSNLAKTASIWLSEIDTEEKTVVKSGKATPYAAHVQSLHRFIEKITVFRQATKGSLDTSGDLEPLYDAYRDYANIVASQGNLKLAEKFLDLLPSQYPGVSLEKERVAKASGHKATGTNNRHYSVSKSPVNSKTRVSAASTAAASIYAAQPQVQAAPVQSNVPLQGVQAQAPVNRYAPSSTVSNPYSATVNPYQTTPQYAAKSASPAPVAPPPMAGQSSSSFTVTPPPPPGAGKVKPAGGWNDLPANAISSRRSTGTAAQTVASPFPNQPPGGSVSPAPMTYGRTPTNNFIPPPPTGVGPPRSNRASPAPPPVSATPPNPYATAVQPGNSFNAPSGAGYGGPGLVPRTGTPSANILSPKNPYAPVAPATNAGPSVPNAYAPPPGAENTAPPMQANTAIQPPSALGASIAAVTAAESALSPAPPQQPVKEEPPAPKYPPGDRSHISSEALPIFNILSNEIERVKPLIPAKFKRQVIDCEKRLNILFDHLNNEDLLAPETVEEMVGLSQAIANKDFDMANQLHLDILTTRVEQCDQWMVGVKRLIEMSKAV